MSSLYRYLATSESGPARFARGLRRALFRISVPAPRWITWPILNLLLGVREVYYFLYRVLWCEPLFKAYCTRYGRNFRTGVFLHWVQGQGELIIGDNVTIDGRCNFFFATRYVERPTLTIGDHTGIGHSCSFTVGDRITIGKHCRIAGGVQMFDAAGHPADPAARLAGKPSERSEVRPIVIGDNVWIGTNSVIFPGVTIGDNSIVGLGSVVMSNVAPNVMVAGNPARQVKILTPKPVESE